MAQPQHPIMLQIPCIPPKSTHSTDLRILKRHDGSLFIGKSSTSNAKRDQDNLRELLKPFAPVTPMTGPLQVFVQWVYPYRKATPKRDQGKMIPCDTRPDADNLQKGLFDVMTDCGFWQDDGQLASVTFEKSWGPEPFIAIRIREAAAYRVAGAEQGVLL